MQVSYKGTERKQGTEEKVEEERGRRWKIQKEHTCSVTGQMLMQQN